MSGQGLRAALDVGSNTIRLMVARPDDGRLEKVLDESEFVRLGAGVDASGRLRPDRVEAGIAAISRLAEAARSAGAETISAIATSAVRDAENGADFVRRVQDETGVDIEIISGEREAYLTFLGATLGVDIRGCAIVCDLGGGSAEVIAANRGGMVWGKSLKIGSGRLSERFVHHDPPTRDEQQAIGEYVAGVLEGLPPLQADVAVFTGGTASHIALLIGAEGTVIDIDDSDLARVVQLLMSEPAAEIVRRYRVMPERAQVLPAGVLGLQSIAQFYEVEHIVISRSGIREGIIIDRLQDEGSWPLRT